MAFDMTTHQSLTQDHSYGFSTDLARWSGSRHSIRLLLYVELLAIDVLSLLAGPILGGLMLHRFNASQSSYAAFALVPLYVVLAINNGSYSISALRRTIESLRRSLSACASSVLLTLVIAFCLKNAQDFSRLSFVVGIGISVIFLIAGRVGFRLHVRKVTAGNLIRELLILDGRPLPKHHDGYTVLIAEMMNLRADLNDPYMLHRFGQTASAFDRIVIDTVPDRMRAWALMLKGANIDGELLVPDSNTTGAIGIGIFNGHDTLRVARKPLSVRSRVQKRALDLAITVPVLIALMPLLVVVACAIKLDSRGPVLFKQNRIGRGNQLFKVLKFRSMRGERCDSTGARSASRDDDRITRVGRFIRATSIDELPQLFNVLIGNMSLVGPRPHALGSLVGDRLFWQIDETYWHRHQLKPGITGLAQVRGFRGATLEMSDLTNRLQADMEYISDWDIWRDLSILLHTFRVIAHKNAF